MIDRIFISVLLLSISGFVFCTVFLVLENLAYRLTSAKVMEKVNTIALFSFVVPLYLALSVFDGSESTFSNYETLVFQDGNDYDGVVAVVRSFPLVSWLGSLWLLGAVCFFIYYLGKYICFLTEVQSGRFEMNGSIWTEKFERLKLEKGIPNVVIAGSSFIPTPCTYGIKTRTILIPAGMINSFCEKEMDFILQHEFYHVIHRDLLKKLLVLLLSGIHWFNPLFHLLRRNLASWQESVSDEEVTKGFDEFGKKEYKNLIVKVMRAEKEQQKKKKFLLRFTGDEMRYYKRRLLRVEGKDRITTTWGKAVVASVTVISVLSGSVVAKAADGPVNQMFSKNVEIVEASDIEIFEGTDIVFDEYINDTKNANTDKFIKFDLIDTADTTYEVIYNDTIMVSSIIHEPTDPKHLHDIIDVTIKEHKKQSDGSCITTYYEGRKCTTCGLTWRGDKINAVTQEICTH